jgi:hypothetical protein
MFGGACQKFHDGPRVQQRWKWQVQQQQTAATATQLLAAGISTATAAS